MGLLVVLECCSEDIGVVYLPSCQPSPGSPAWQGNTLAGVCLSGPQVVCWEGHSPNLSLALCAG